MAEIHLDFMNLNTLLLVVLILMIGGYLYYEIYKMKLSFNDIHYKINTIEKSLLNNSINENDIKPIAENYKPIEENYKPIEEIHYIDENIDENFRNNDISSIDNDIHKQMIDDSSSESDRSDRSDISDILDRSDDKPPENNRASIDDILSDKHIITDNSLSDILNVDDDLSKIDEFMNTIKIEGSTKIIKKEYKDMTVSELKKLLADKKLPVSGNKTKLIERIENSE